MLSGSLGPQRPPLFKFCPANTHVCTNSLPFSPLICISFLSVLFLSLPLLFIISHLCGSRFEICPPFLSPSVPRLPPSLPPSFFLTCTLLSFRWPLLLSPQHMHTYFIFVTIFSLLTSLFRYTNT